MTVATQASLPASRESDDALLVARARIGLWVVLAAIAIFTLADSRLANVDLHRAALVRLAQLVLIGAASVALRARMTPRGRVAAVTAFVAGIYVTSAVAGYLRHGVATQPVTGLVIAFTTATTLPWGAWPQLASVLIALAAIAADFWIVDGGTLAMSSPHMVAGVVLAFAVSVYIAHQLGRFRRERDAAEAALRRSEERFRALVEHGSDVITICDAEGIIRYETPAVERLTGYQPAELVGQRAATQVHPDDLDALRTSFATASPAPCRVRRRDGSWCHVEAMVTNLLDHPAVGGIVVNWRDVSERARAEADRTRHMRELALARDEALASTRAKSMFLANMSHEIRTPMNVILGMTDMVLDGDLAPAQRRDLERVRAAAIGLLQIINDVLDASKIEAGKMTIDVVEMDLAQTLREAVGLLMPAATGKGLALTLAVAPGLPTTLRGDPGRIRQTVVNLISNAIKFTDAGAVTVEADVQRQTATHASVRLSVRDTGIGIAPERQATIFESFAQGEESTTRLYGGTGLGLAISRQLVTLMGGAIGLESTPGAGSTFWVDLTLERVAGTRAAAAA